MLNQAATLQRFAELPSVYVRPQALLSAYTRFALGGPCAALIEVSSAAILPSVFALLRESALPWIVIGGGSNLVVSDAGFPGLVIRFSGAKQEVRDEGSWAESGALWQHVVDFHVDAALEGMEKMTGIPGWLGGAVYGNAGAYGQTIMDFVTWVEVFDGYRFHRIPNVDCGFVYRASNFKSRKDWLVTAAQFQLRPGDKSFLAETSADILRTRNEKFPPTMKCAGSIFKNQLADHLPSSVLNRVPPHLIRSGKIPSAWFLEQVGAKGFRNGGIEVASYHANLIYNTGSGKSAELLQVIDELKARVENEFGFSLEEEVQFVGFPNRKSH